MRPIFLAVAAVAITVGGCGGGASPSGGLGFRNRSVLTSEEIRVGRDAGSNAYDLIQKLRPEFLRSRGRVSLSSPAQATAVVYVDDLRYGSLQSLRNINAEQIYSVVFIGASEATTRFGTDHVGGAILITTK